MLQACDRAARTSTEGIGSVASLVAEQNVPVVVAMQYEIANLTARQFVLEMYRRVAQLEPVDQAVQEARRMLANKQSYEQRAFATPVLYMRTEDGNLFRRRSTHVPRVTQITQQVTALGPVLQSIAWAPSDVRAAYQAVAPAGPWIAPPAESTDPAETVRRMLDTLATAPADDSGFAPVLELVQRLAGMSVVTSIRATLEQWVTQIANDLGAEPTTLAAMRERVQAGADSSSSQMLYLLIQVATTFGFRCRAAYPLPGGCLGSA